MVSKFSGSKGGGGGTSSAVSTPDNLLSTDVAEVIMGLCEGPIEGLIDGDKSFFLGDTPLRSVSGGTNFENFYLDVYNEGGETITPTLGGTSKPSQVGVSLAKNVPVNRTTMTGKRHFIEFRLLVSYLSFTNSSGSYNSTFTYTMRLKKISSDVWEYIYPGSITGKTSGGYVHEFRVPVDYTYEGAYLLQIEKTSDDTNGNTLTSEVKWESFEEVTNRTFSFNALSCVKAFIQTTDQFSSVPEMTGEYKLRKIKVPTNYDPITHTYNGTWDGTFNVKWTDNPAWCLYDLVTNAVFGINAHYPITMDKWQVYEAAQWCDTRVPDGLGGTEPRFTMNALFQEVNSAREQAKYMAGLFCGCLVDNHDGTLGLLLDSEPDALHLFTTETVSPEGFSYSYTDPGTRYNDITVTFVNPEMRWVEDRRRVFNQEDIDLNGRVPYDFIAVGCIAEREAYRRGYYQLITSLTEKEMVNFTTNRLGSSVALYDIILVADPMMGYGITGRIKSQVGKVITLRDGIALEAGFVYKISFRNDNTSVAESTFRVSSSGSYKVINLDSDLPRTLPERAAFAITQTDLNIGVPKPYRVTGISTDKENPESLVINAIEVNRNKWTAVDNLEFLESNQYSYVPNIDNVPDPLSVSMTPRYESSTQTMWLTFNVELDTQAYPYYSGEVRVYSRLKNSEDSWTEYTRYPGNVIKYHPSGDFEFKILPKNSLGATGNFALSGIWYFNVPSIDSSPAKPSGFNVVRTTAGLQLSWKNEETSRSVSFYIYEGANNDSVALNVASDKYITVWRKYGDLEFKLYAVDTRGQRSEPAIFNLTLAPPVTPSGFKAIQTGVNVRCSWYPIDTDEPISYELRAGSDFSTSVRISYTNANSFEFSVDNYPYNKFWLRAIDMIGVYSINPTFATGDIQAYQINNVLVETDQTALSYPGHQVNLYEAGSRLALLPDLNYGEYIFDADLTEELHSRVLLQDEVGAIVTDYRADEMSWPANDTRNQVAVISSLTSLGDVEVDRFISLNKSIERPDLVEGFTLYNTLTGIKGTEESSGADAAYLAGRFRNGLYVNDSTYVSWALDVPAEFSMTFWIRPMVLTSARYISFQSAEGHYLTLTYDPARERLRLRGRDGISTQVDVLDAYLSETLFVGINQTATKRKLFIGRVANDSVIMGEVDAPPQGAFNLISLF